MKHFQYFFVFSFIFIILSIILKIYNFNITNLFSMVKNVIYQNSIVVNNNDGEILFTNDELKYYNGITKKQLYISILGVVYDVSRSEKYYGPGQSYHVFTGRDASRSFITGEFDENKASDEVASLKYDELLSIKQWQAFYEKEYSRKGKLIGRYYDEYGNSTPYAKVVEKLMKEAEKQKDEKDLDEKLYPGCNIEWNAETGSRVWCSTKSGGVHRSWTGYPRKYYKPGSDSHRCACIESPEDNNANMALYDNCDKNSESCYVA